MELSRRHFLKATGAVALIGAVPLDMMQALAAPPEQAAAWGENLHFLNRISYGARPEDMERINAIGIEAYLEEQLDPAALDDSAADAILAKIAILNMDRHETYRLTDPEYRTWMALVEGMVLRAVHTKRQLHERMVEFWLDHFNIPADELGTDLVIYHREIVRRHALGNFRDLAFSTAQSPAMLYYLDNYLSVAEHPNENYARELMELHTLGVDGGYTEDDVKAVARALTGWTVNNATETGFYFDPTVHDTLQKDILGHHLPPNRGIEDGLHVLSILVNHESTARFVSRKLCVRFVSDNPPPALVESAAQVWMANDGEIKPVLRHIFTSDEFRQSAGQKLRRPLEFFIAALRATGTQFREFWIMDELLQDLAQRPYGWAPPNGYPDAAGAWTNSAGLLARWNTAMTLTHSAVSEEDTGMTTELYERIGHPDTVGGLVDAISTQVFAVPLPADLRATFVDYASDGAGESLELSNRLLAQKVGTLYGLMIASPLFQWH
jgi:uncharacterized protein (DUF1800 family)